MTAGQQALADGFAANLSVHGQLWQRTSDSAAFYALASKLTVENPQMPQAQDRATAIVVADRDLSPPLPAAYVMPVSRLKKGDELVKGTKKYRVVRADYQEGSAMWIIVLSPTF